MTGRKPGRPRTRPPIGEPKATQQMLRNIAKAHKTSRAISAVCGLMIGQLYELPLRVTEGHHAAAENLRKSIERSTKRLAELMTQAKQ